MVIEPVTSLVFQEISTKLCFVCRRGHRGPELLQKLTLLPENQAGNMDTAWCQSLQPDQRNLPIFLPTPLMEQKNKVARNMSLCAGTVLASQESLASQGCFFPSKRGPPDFVISNTQLNYIEISRFSASPVVLRWCSGRGVKATLQNESIFLPFALQSRAKRLGYHQPSHLLPKFSMWVKLRLVRKFEI